MVGYWSFDEGVGIYANDSSGNGNTGKLIASAGWTSGKYGGGINLDGVSYVEVKEDPTGPSSNLKLNTFLGFTVTTWVYIDSTDPDGGYILCNPWNGGGQYNYCMYNSGVNILGSTPSSISGVAFSKDSWNHVAFTVDSTTLRWYVNGLIVSSGAHNIISWAPSSGDSNVALAIGTLFPYGVAVPTGHAIKGKIDETRIWRRVLTSEEIKNIYQGNLIAVNKGCIADSTPTPDKPLQIISQVSKNVPNGESETSSVVIKASNSPVDTVCEICTTPLGGGGCVDVRVIVK